MVVISDIQAGADEVAGTVRAGGRTHRIFFSSADVSLWPAPEAFLLLALPAAMRLGEPLQVEQPVSRRLAGQLQAIQALYRQWDYGLQEVEVMTVCRADDEPPVAREGLFFTGGADSFYAALRLPAAGLVFLHGLDIPLGETELRRQVAQRLRGAAGELGREYIEIETNLRELSDRHFPWWLAFGGALAACGHLLCRRFGRIGIATSYSANDEHIMGRRLPDGSHPDLTPLFSSGAVQFRSVGQGARRIKKLEALAESPAARQGLRVCWENPGGAYNCGTCEKCLRTMAGLEAVGVLDCFSCFDRPLDLRRLKRAVSGHPSADVFVHENLAVARERGADPRLIASLEAILNSRTAQLWRWYGQWIPLRVQHWLHRLSRVVGGNSA